MFYLQPQQKKLLSSFNPIIVVSVVGIALVFKSSVATFISSNFKLWELLLPFLIYWGQRRGLTEGIILTLFCSHLVSISSGAPIGIYACVSFIIYLGARLVSLALYAETWATILALVSLFSFLLRFVMAGVGFFFGYTRISDWWSLPWGNYLMINAILGLSTFYFLQILDKITFKMTPSEIEISGEAL